MKKYKKEYKEIEYKKVWFNCFGNDQSNQIDPFGREMQFSKAGNKNHKLGWDIDHIWPLNPKKGHKGSKSYANRQPLNCKSNVEKANNIEGEVNGWYFELEEVKRSNNRITAIMYVESNDEDETLVLEYDYNW